MRAPAGWLFAPTIMLSLGSLAGLSACPAPRRPVPPTSTSVVDVSREGGSLRGLAGDPATVYAAITTGSETVVEARRAARIVWTSGLAGHGGPLARTATLVVAAVSGEAAAGLELRGAPGAVVAGLDAASGAIRWRLAFDSSGWTVVTAVAGERDHVIVGGSFSGTLRVGSRTVSSAGQSDGFAAKLTAGGEVVWLTRLGGPGADAVAGVAARGARVAIAGIFAPGAELSGHPLESQDERTPRADGVVAELDERGARTWSATFGGQLDDSVAGVAIDAAGRVVVAANAREVFKIASGEVVAMGDSDGVVAWWEPTGAPGPVVQLGGPEFDGLRAIVATGDRIVVGGFFSGTMRAGTHSLTAAGGDDAFFAELEDGKLIELAPVTGAGREEIAALAAVPGGYVAAITHSARATIDSAELPAPRHPTGGAAIATRAAR